MDSLKSALARLKSIGWFSEIDGRYQDLLSADARLITASPGDTIFHFGDPGAGLFGIVSGSVMLSCGREDGVLVPFVTLGSGYWIGDLAALSGKPGLVSIEVRSALVAVTIPAKSVRKLVETVPEIYEAFYLLNSINQGLSLRLLAGLTAETAVKRIELRLRILSEYAEYEEGWIDLTHSDLAEQLGVSIPTIQRGLKSLKAKGVVELGYGKVRLRNGVQRSEPS